MFDNLAFKVDGEVVTLLGQVTRPSLRSGAERVVSGIEGVSEVVNQIEVLPVSPNGRSDQKGCFRGDLQPSGIEPVRLPVRAANSHHCAER